MTRHGLSPRELEVTNLVAEGHGDGAIAYLLDISPNTVRKHVSSALHKLDFHNRVQLAVWFVRQTELIR